MKRSVLSDKDLLRAYDQAQNLNLDQEFIRILEREIELRNLSEILPKPQNFKMLGFWILQRNKIAFILQTFQAGKPTSSEVG